MGGNTPTGPRPEEVVDAFFSVAHAFRRFVDTRFRDTPLSMARLKVLHELTDRGATRMGELSECLAVAARTMTSTVDGLERDGLVERRPDPRDGRATVVSITARGRRTFEKGSAIRNAAVGELFAVLDDRERAAFMATLGKLAAVATTDVEDETGGAGAVATERADAR